MDESIITRGQAKARGLKYYYTCRACINGHITERYTKNGLCIKCAAKNTKASRERHPETVEKCRERARTRQRELKKQYTLEEVKEIRTRRNAYQKAYRLANLAAVKAIAQKYRKKSPEIAALRTRKRKCKLKGAVGSHTVQQILELLQRQMHRCATCDGCVKKRYHADHIMPLHLGGSNDIANIQILCPTCNTRKGAKHPLQWAKENGLLV